MDDQERTEWRLFRKQAGEDVLVENPGGSQFFAALFAVARGLMEMERVLVVYKTE